MLTFMCALLHFTVDRGLFLVEVLSMTHWPMMHIISSTLHPLIWYGLVFTILGRFWIIRYNIECVRAQCDNEWRSVINNEYMEENWFVRNKATFGNGKFIFSRFILPVYLVCAVGAIFVDFALDSGDSLGDSNHHAHTYEDYVHQFTIDSCVTILPYFFMAFLWSKTSDIGDTLWMRREQFFLFVIFMVGVFVNLVLGFCVVFLFRLRNDVEGVIHLALLESHVMAGVSFLIILIMTYGVLSQNNYSLRATSALQPFLREHVNNLNKQNSRLSLTEQVSNSGLSPVSLKTALSDHIMFYAFMNHLASEFSMESLLSVVEFVQYKAYILEHCRDYLSSRHDYTSQMVELPKDLPQSSIVFGNCETTAEQAEAVQTTTQTTTTDVPSIADARDVPSIASVADSSNSLRITSIEVAANGSGCHRGRSKSTGGGLYDSLRPFQTKAQLLYDKYIRVEAVYEINISYEMRISFARLLENEQAWTVMFEHSNKNAAKMQAEKMISDKLHEIIELLNNTIDEMVRLLHHSYSRFKTTLVYEKHMKRMSVVQQAQNNNL